MSEPIHFDDELFHPVPDEEGVYASESGRIAFYDTRFGEDFRLAFTRVLGGFLRVHYFVGGKRRDRMAARLIWRAFQGPVPSTHWVDTVSGDPADVQLANLLLRTRREVNGGLTSGRAKLCRREVLEIKSQRHVRIDDLVEQYGVSQSTISNLRSGNSYRDVEVPDDPPATDEQRDRLRHRMQQVGIEDDFVQLVLERVRRSGRVSLPRRAAEEAGVSHWHRITRIRLARQHGLLRQIGKQMYHVAVDMPEHAWQSHLDDISATDHQRETLALRLRRALADLPEVPHEVVDGIVGVVAPDGRFAKTAIQETTLSLGQYRLVMSHLIESGVAEGAGRHYLRFVDMPPRQPKQVHRGSRQSVCISDSADYHAAVRMIIRGDDLDSVAHECHVPASVAQKMSKALSMVEITNQLIASGRRDQLPRLLGVPEPAADAIAEYASRDRHSGIQSAIR